VIFAEFDPETWASDVDQYFQLIDDPSSLWQHGSSSNHITDIGNCTLSSSTYQQTTLSSYTCCQLIVGFVLQFVSSVATNQCWLQQLVIVMYHFTNCLAIQ